MMLKENAKQIDLHPAERMIGNPLQGNHKPNGKNKIKTLDELTVCLAQLRLKGQKIVHCHGVFDLLHIGHIRYFEQAQTLGDVLIVTLTPDNFVDKGPYRPAFNEMLRAEAIASLSSVDFVAINKWPTAENTLRLLRPDFYVKGSEFKEVGSDITGKIDREAQVVREIGATLAFTEDIVFSSSNLINEYLSNLPKEIDGYMRLFRQRFHLDYLLEIIERMAELDVLVIGDTILDEYQYCDAIGKSSKDPTLAIRYKAHDLFAGGVLAVANHVANFARSVTLISVIGEQDSHEQFIRSQLHANIIPHFVTQPDAPTTIKRRFIDSNSFNKLLEVYVMDDSGLPDEDMRALQTTLKKELAGHDLTIASDFGHGAISNETVSILSDQARFLAVNTQANASNRGFHTLSRYPGMHYASIAEHELKLELRKTKVNIRPEMHRIAQAMGCRQFAVTRGRSGCAVADPLGDFVQVPTFTERVVDRVGAGDAFLSLTAMAAIQDVPCEVLGFLGNVAGALAVEIIGNKKAFDKSSVQKYITALMK